MEGTPGAKSEKVVSFGNFSRGSGATRPSKYSVPRYRETMAGGRGHLGSSLLRGKEIFRNRKWTSAVFPPRIARRRVRPPHVRWTQARDRKVGEGRGLSFSLSLSLTKTSGSRDYSIPRNFHGPSREISKAAFEWGRENKLYGKMKQS